VLLPFSESKGAEGKTHSKVAKELGDIDKPKPDIVIQCKYKRHRETMAYNCATRFKTPARRVESPRST